MTNKTYFDLIQRFQVVDGVPKLLSSHVEMIDSPGFDDLMSIAQLWLKNSTAYIAHRESQYIGYKSVSERYEFILAICNDGLWISSPHISGELDKLFPYCKRKLAKNANDVVRILNDSYNSKC
ncbi:MAG: hypothetical protein QQW96_03825 [Tychonema bourrellyi B0820]|nr:hypothetical protein [Tychonema bourrellyi B0820]PJE45233.1 MAG: hypothetical protein CUR32_01130 [Flavobacterium sp.] [Flavobacterium sp. FEMGT703F]